MTNLRKPLVTLALASSALGLSFGVGLNPADAAHSRWHDQHHLFVQLALRQRRQRSFSSSFAEPQYL